MTLKREPTRRRTRAGYPTLDEVRGDRRAFLQRLGGGALAALGLAACETAAEQGVGTLVGDGRSGHDASTLADAEPPVAGGMALPDTVDPPPDVPRHEGGSDTGEPPLPGEPIEPPPDVQEPLPDVEDPPVPGGIGEPDVIDPPPDGLEPPLGGDMPAPDIVQPPPDVEDPFIGGDMPAPDIVQSPDTGEEPPIDGDMPLPEGS